MRPARSRCGAPAPDPAPNPRAVVAAVEVHALLAAQAGADDPDGLVECLHALARRAPRPAHRGHAVPERARAQPQLEAPAAHQVERRRLLGQQRRVAQRQVGDVGEEAEALRARQQVADQREGVEEAALVRMVLDADQVEPAALGGGHHRERVAVGVCRWVYEEAEPERHGREPRPARPPGPTGARRAGRRGSRAWPASC